MTELAVPETWDLNCCIFTKPAQDIFTRNFQIRPATRGFKQVGILANVACAAYF